MASTYLTRTPSSAGNRRTWTWSAWIKKATIAVSPAVTLFGAKDGGYPEILYFASDDTLVWQHDISGSDYLLTISNKVFRDTNAWYHIVLTKDTTQSTEANRVKIYINGEQQTLTESQLGFPGQNYEGAVNNNVTHTIGNWEGNSYYFDGSMSHVHFIDGTAYDASAFGETDATTGEWKIKTDVSVTYGTNGFFILKDGNSVTDQSGNSNNFTVGGGTLTKTEDSPSNVFATMNPLVTYGTNQNALSVGNNTTTGIAYHRPSPPTLAVNKGKWYFEAKALSGTATKWWIGLCDAEYDTNNQGSVGSTSNYIWGYDATTNAVNQRSQAIYDVNLRDGGGNISISNIFSAPSANDIYAMAVDLDNQKVWYAKNGVWNNGSASQSTTFNASYPDSTNIDADRFYYIGVGSENSKWSVNYGNGYFGTTAVSSAGTNASGNGIFEFDCPVGYTALSTKGLNL